MEDKGWILEELRHKNMMEEIQVKYVCEKEILEIKRQNELEIQRIRSAEIRKSVERRNDMRFEGYGKTN